MKTAIIISGHMRTFDLCLANLHWHVFRHFPGADFFVSTVADNDAPKANLLSVKYPQALVEIEAVPEQPDCIAILREKGVTLPDVFRKGAPYMHEPYNISVHPRAVAAQLWQLERGYDLHNLKKGHNYDCVVRCRPDLWFHSSVAACAGIAPENAPGDSAWVPWWGRFGGVNDRFAILWGKAAYAYFRTWSFVPAMLKDGAPLHPETLVAESLRLAGVQVLPLLVEFSTARNDGSLRPPEILPQDMGHLHLFRAP